MAIDQLRAVALDPNADKGERREALQSLVEAKVGEALGHRLGDGNDRDLAPAAMRSLSALGRLKTPSKWLAVFATRPPKPR